jgi:hypothetical protein
MIHSDFLGFFFFGMTGFFILLGLWAWWGASEGEDEGEMVELHSLGQTTYREPWLQKVGALLCFGLAVGTAILGMMAFM